MASTRQLRGRAHAPSIALFVVAAAAALLPLEGALWRTAAVLLAEFFAAAGACVAAALTARRGGERATAWWFLCAGTGGWAAGAGLWTWYKVIQHVEPPFPSPADVGFLLFPALACVGLLVRPTGPTSGFARLATLLDGLLVLAALAGVAWVLALSALVADADVVDTALVISMASPAMDVLLVAVALIVAVRSSAAQRGALLVLCLGVSAIALSDIAFLVGVADGGFAAGTWVDLGWVGGFLLVAVAARRDRTDDRAGAEVAWLWLLPYAVAAVGLATVGALLVLGRSDTMLRSVGLALVVALFLRQVLEIIQNRHLLARLSSAGIRLHHQAYHDGLTGVPNRSFFVEEVARALLSPDRAAVTVLFCDLDDFKPINDGLGHAAGDELLVAVAQRLTACVREGDVVARLGGDEFAILARSAAPDLPGRVVTAFGSPFQVGRDRLEIGCSVGAVTTDPDERLDAGTVLQRADVAMYSAKQAGGHMAQWWSRDMASATDELRLREDLALALVACDVRAWRQVLVDRDGSVVGFEALARWHRGDTVVTPDVLIPLATRAGLLTSLDVVVARDALRAAATMDPRTVVTVNVSLESLLDRRYAEGLQLALLDHDIAPERLVVEVSEDVLAGREDDVLAAARGLLALGVRLAVDDFGSGHSSLARLQALAPHVVKLDRSLVVGIAEDSEGAFGAGVVALIHSLGALVIAEGIETQDQADRLSATGCDFQQGFLHGRPAPDGRSGDTPDVHPLTGQGMAVDRRR